MKKGESKECGQKYDYDKINELQKMEEMLFNSTSNSLDESQAKRKDDVLIKHANFLHNFGENSIQAKDIVPLFLTKHGRPPNKEK